MRENRLLLLLTVLLVAGCGMSAQLGNASYNGVVGSESETTSDLDVTLTQVSTPMVMPTAEHVNETIPVDVRYAISVTNHLRTSVTIKRIDLRSVGSTNAALQATTRRFDRKLAPGEMVTLDYWATLEVRNANAGADSPAMIRVGVQFDDGGQSRHEGFNRAVNGSSAVTIGG